MDLREAGARAEADRVRPIHKVRTSNERHYPGGGGVNVARVLDELGSPADEDVS